MEQSSFGKNTLLFTMSTSKYSLSVSDYGSSLIDLVVKDKEGNPIDIVLGYDDVSGYETDAGNYFGCNVGRNANRISNAKFVLNDVEYNLDKNDGMNNLHSGCNPYSKRIWDVEQKEEGRIVFSLESPHMDQGFPGNLKMYVTYEVVNDNTFRIVYEAVPDRDTIINMTNHSYFNLNGEGSGTICNHRVTLWADSFTPADKYSIPTGEIISVENTPMDFRKGKTIGEEIEAGTEQLINGKGYDHNWITDVSGRLHDIVRVEGDKSGIVMTIATDYPGVQMYTGNFLNGVYGKKGHIYSKREGLCFEPQYYPDAVNRPEFISPICQSGEKYRKEIVYTFEQKNIDNIPKGY